MKELTEMHLPNSVKYAKDHEWVAVAAPYRVGVSDFAQDQLGDITFAELPEVGKKLAKGEEFGSLESIKSVSSLYLPIGGVILAVNDALNDDPGLVNRDPYGDGWLVEIQPDQPAQLGELMDAAAYRQSLKDNA